MAELFDAPLGLGEEFGNELRIEVQVEEEQTPGDSDLFVGAVAMIARYSSRSVCIDRGMRGLCKISGVAHGARKPRYFLHLVTSIVGMYNQTEVGLRRTVPYGVLQASHSNVNAMMYPVTLPTEEAGGR